MTPGLARMTARASANEPFARASVMLAELAGVPVTARRAERHAEADGAAAAVVIEERAAAIRDRTVIPPPPGVSADSRQQWTSSAPLWHGLTASRTMASSAISA
jgi:hypothetical protein